VSARAWAGLWVVYLVWGSTYLGIMVAIRTLPPFLMSSVRFLLAGLVLTLWTIRGGARPTAREWLAALISGAALLTVGNGGITWAEQRVDSGVAALLVATMPLWLAVLDRVVHGTRLSAVAVAGLVVGLGGVAILVSPGNGHVDLVGGLVCVGSALAWAAGSLYSRGSALARRPLAGAGLQMLAGGALLAVAGLAAGEAGSLDLGSVSGESVVALAYLVVVGSIVAFSAYVWLLKTTPTALVSTYAYVNPVVAVLLGAAFLSEPLGLRTLLAGLAIVVSVAMIVTAQAAPGRRSTERLRLPKPREEGATLAA
jgi:drug/metabolite transporter (DMT)-like permease